jgi:hypothetical protein
MQLTGILIGIITFIMIGVLHVAVVRIERVWGSKFWPGFVFLGLILCIVSIFVDDFILSANLGVLGFLFAWSGPELKKQKERTKRKLSH